MIGKERIDITLFKDQFKAILSVKLITQAKNVFEQVFWSFIVLLATIYISYIMIASLNYWNENPRLVTKGSKPLSEMKQPAVTFCHKGLQKYAVVERLANYIDPAKEIPEQVYRIRNEGLKIHVHDFKSKFPFENRHNFCNLDKKNGQWLLNPMDKYAYPNCEVVCSIWIIQLYHD